MIPSINTLVNSLPQYGTAPKIAKNDQATCSINNIHTRELDVDAKSIHSSSEQSSSLSSPRSSPISSTDSINTHNLKTSHSLDLIIKSLKDPLTDDNIRRHSELLLSDFDASLSANAITMLANYNISPTGDEHGSYLAVDLGGSTLRVAVVDLAPQSESISRSDRIKVVLEEKWLISNEYKVINRSFFKFIGSKITEIIDKQETLNPSQTIKVGITWSFPLDTTSHNNGKIRHVSKGYTIGDDVYDKDLKHLFESILQEEFDLSFDIKSILNDSLAVYAAGAFLDDKMRLAMVLGTGFNMCCSLDASKDYMHASKLIDRKMLFNTELSLFGQHLCDDFSTKYDAVIDNRFDNFKHHFKTYLQPDPNSNLIFQPHELMTSGRYLPELTRLVLADLIGKKEIFTNFDSEELNTIETVKYDGFEGELMCFISECDDFEAVGEKMRDVYHWDKIVLDSDIAIIKHVIKAIVQRAAFIVANAIIAFFKLLKKYNRSEDLKGLLTIGYVGSVLNHFHSYRNSVIDYVNMSEDARTCGYKIDLKLIENSSIIGAAIGAAYYSK
ncbi:NAG5 [Candida theae]|uniref:Phosphotransferase n=1 Tax=Candida theae TaxID=1198502 RepID=A0AAD5BHI3_9ASCO|nr:NAG5 [Candida theae]KAI5963860.1 NAG5 [Candida theae]